jgi:hypothetical protein
MSIQRFPEEMRPMVRVAYAAAWEALVETHGAQAVQLMLEFAPRIPPLQGLELYFHVVGVPDPMIEWVRNRALTRFELDSALPTTAPCGVSGWRRLRLDLVLRQAKARRHFHERTLELARMAGARAAEEVLTTHVANALAFARLLHRVLPIERAVEHYVHEFSLSLAMAQAVAQRAQAQLAAEQLALQYREEVEVVDYDPPRLRLPASLARET